MPENGPIHLSQPDEAYYPVEKLELFTRFNRDTYQKKFGEQAPPWEQRRRIKRWFDTTVLKGVEDPDNAMAAYEYFDAGSRSFRRMVLSAREAAAVNLPGLFVYPKYVVPPTAATIATLEGVRPYPANLLCTLEEAEAINREIGGEGVEDSKTFEGGAGEVEWNGEVRRSYVVRFKNNLLQASFLIQQKNACGVGAPGHWDLNGKEPRWMTEVQLSGEQDPRPEIPIPCRKLLPNEVVRETPWGVMIVRIDKESPYTQPQTSAGGGFGAEDRAALQEIRSNVQKLIRLALPL